MAEYIEKEAFLEQMKKTDRYFDIKFDVEAFPAADVVEVVRCKDCKHNHWELEPCHGKTIHYCNAFGFKIDITDALHEFFCGYGERRSE